MPTPEEFSDLFQPEALGHHSPRIHGRDHEQQFRWDRRKSNYRSLICEGDSWFRNPLRIKTMVDWLNVDKLGYDYYFAVLNRANPGDTAEVIASKIHSVRRDVEKYLPDAFLLSAGGNDLLGGGNLKDLLLPAAQSGYINEENFTRFGQKVAVYLWQIIETVNIGRPGMPIFLHSYDYPRSSGQRIWLGPIQVGPWIKPVLDELNYSDADERRQVVMAALDQFVNIQLGVVQAMQTWARNQGVLLNLHHVDLRNTVTNDDNWPDEIHTDSGSNEAYAKKMKDAIDHVLNTMTV